MSTGKGAATRPEPGRRRRSPIYVDRSEVKEALGITENRTLAKYVEQGSCPPPARWLTRTRPVWARKEWEAWLRVRQVPPADSEGPAIQSSADVSSSAR